MSFTLKTISAIGLSLFISGFVYAQGNKSAQTKEITVCPFEIAASARTANFRVYFLYQLEVDASGKVSKVTEISSQNRGISRFVRHELFVDCMKQWQLNPSGKYSVGFYVGTTSNGVPENMPQNYMRIVDPDKKVLIIELSFSEKDLLKIIEPKK